MGKEERGRIPPSCFHSEILVKKKAGMWSCAVLVTVINVDNIDIEYQ